MAAHAAMPILWIVVSTREQLAGPGRLDDEGGAEIRLIEPHLRGVLRKCFLKPVALDRAPRFPIGRLVLPEERIIEVGTAQRVWSGNDDAVGMAAQASVHSGECQSFGRRELEAGGDQALTRGRIGVSGSLASE